MAADTPDAPDTPATMPHPPASPESASRKVTSYLESELSPDLPERHMTATSFLSLTRPDASLKTEFSFQFRKTKHFTL